MEFHEKLQELRKRKGLTQEALAQELFVSRTAVSKWESGRGYPGIDSLKQIAKLFSVTIDELLSGDELLNVAEAEQKKKALDYRNLTFGFMDITVAMLLFLPVFGQVVDGVVQNVSLIEITHISAYLKVMYISIIALSTVVGVLTLALQNCEYMLWLNTKNSLSLLVNTFSVLLFVLSRQPYAAVFLIVLLAIKALMLMKQR